MKIDYKALFADNDSETIEANPLVATKIKPCKYCGKSPKFLKNKIYVYGIGFNSEFGYYLKCTNSKCKIKPKTDSYATFRSSCADPINTAVNEWNYKFGKE